MKRHSAYAALLAGFVLVGSCYTPEFSDCVIACDTDGSCPRDFHCGHGFCWSRAECLEPEGGRSANATGGGSSAGAGNAGSSDAGSGNAIPSGGDAGERGLLGRAGSVEPSGDAGYSGSAGNASNVPPGLTIPDLTDRIDPSLSLPSWSWRFLWNASNAIPVPVGRNAAELKVFLRGADNAIVEHKVGLVADAGLEEGWFRTYPGGLFLSDPAVMALGPNDVHVFARGHDELCYYEHWDGAGWSIWRNMPVSLNGGPVATAVGTAQLFVLGRGFDNHLVYRVADARPEEWSATPWRTLQASTRLQPAIASGPSGTVYIAKAEDDGVFAYARWQNGVDYAEDFSWLRLEGVTFRSPPVLVSRASANADLFGRGLDGDYYWNAFNGEVWSGWAKIGHGFVSSPAAVADTADSCYVFAKDSAGNIWARKRAASSWSAWQVLPGDLSREVDADFPGSAVAFNSDDIRLEVHDAQAFIRELASEPP